LRGLIGNVLLRLFNDLVVGAAFKFTLEGLGGQLAIFEARVPRTQVSLAAVRRDLDVGVPKAREHAATRPRLNDLDRVWLRSCNRTTRKLDWMFSHADLGTYNVQLYIAAS